MLLSISPRVPGIGAIAQAQRPLNLDFERRAVAYADRPWGWSLGWSAFAGGPMATFALDSTVRLQGLRSLRITASDTAVAPAERAMMLQLSAAFARGKSLTLTGAIRTQGLRGRAAVRLEAWRDREVAAGDTAVVRGDLALQDTARRGAGRAGWQRFTLRIRAPTDASVHSISIACLVAGSGSAWFDDLQLSVDGAVVTSLPTAEGPPPTRAELAWLAKRSTPLLRVAPENDVRGPVPPDLALVSRIVGDARVVALGESTHGTREFFQVKHRLLQHLVRNDGFDLFAIEANQLAVERLNAYVGGAPGTARDAMRVLFRVWNTEGMLAIVQWMRSYNSAAPPKRLHFIGYDMQDHQTPVDSLEAFVRRVEPAYLGRVRALTGEYRSESNYATPRVAEGKRSSWHARTDSLWREVSARRERWLRSARSRSDTMAAEWAIHDADLVRQAAQLNVTLFSPDRDSLMAANLDWALRTLYPASRAVVWAHDVHVSHGGDAKRSFNQGAQMGAVLKHGYGYDYRAFSLLTRAGQYSASRSFSDYTMATMEGDVAPDGSVERLLSMIPHAASSLGVITDLRVDERDPEGAFLWRARPIRSIGYAAFDYSFDLRAIMPLEFDGVVFIDRTTASQLLPPRPR
ncbi:MAG: erythromycin esterase family protein [Gemmatimonadota bacterium]